MFSRRVKEAVKTGLAMAIAYGIALAMDWDNPYWAGFAVAMISLSTTGQSLNKGAMRMLGTLVAAVVSLSLVALFPQDRWHLMIALSIYLAICGYMLTGKRFQYFWFASAFVCVIIVVSGGPDSENAFETAVARAQETGMGILVYGLISAFLWPQSSRPDLEAANLKLTCVQHQLFCSYRTLMVGEGKAEATHTERMQQIRLAGQTGQALAAAETDSYEVWEVRHLWRRLHQGSIAIGEALEKWRESFPEVRELDLHTLFPNLNEFCDRVNERFSAIEETLSGAPSKQNDVPTTLSVDDAAMRSASHFQRAAATVTRSQLERIDELSRNMLDSARSIMSLEMPAGVEPPQRLAKPPLTIDVDRLNLVVRVLATLWVAYLLWVYVNPPGHASFVEMATIMALVFAMTPQISPLSMLVPFGCGTIVAGLIYVFIMPLLSTYWQLGSMIFIITAAIYYLFAEPRYGLAKMGAIVPFVALTSIQNQQSYDFATYANSAAMIMLAISLNIVMAYIPTSPRPEKVFLRLLARYFGQIDFLLSRIALNWEQTAGFTGRLKSSFHGSDLLELWQKMAACGPHIDTKSVPDATNANVQELVNSLGALAFRMKELLEVRELPQGELMVRELLDDFRAWRLAILDHVRLWSENPEAAAKDQADLRDLLNKRLTKLEDRIEEFFRDTDTTAFDDQTRQNLYRVLGSYRGLSEAFINFATIGRDIDWSRWHEARF